MAAKTKDLQGPVDAGTQGARHTPAGGEVLDDRQVNVPLRFRGKAVTTYQDAMQLLNMASRLAEQEGMESEEEANDFGVEDDEGFEDTGSSVFTEQDERQVLAIHKRVLEEQERRKNSKVEQPPPEVVPDVKKEVKTPE